MATEARNSDFVVDGRLYRLTLPVTNVSQYASGGTSLGEIASEVALSFSPEVTPIGGIEGGAPIGYQIGRDHPFIQVIFRGRVKDVWEMLDYGGLTASGSHSFALGLNNNLRRIVMPGDPGAFTLVCRSGDAQLPKWIIPAAVVLAVGALTMASGQSYTGLTAVTFGAMRMTGFPRGFAEGDSARWPLIPAHAAWPVPDPPPEPGNGGGEDDF